MPPWLQRNQNDLPSDVPTNCIALVLVLLSAAERHFRGMCDLNLSTQAIIDRFTVVYSVTWPLNGSGAGGDLVLIQISLLLLCKSSCSYAN